MKTQFLAGFLRKHPLELFLIVLAVLAGMNAVRGNLARPASESTTYSGAIVPITRQQRTSDGTSFGWLYDHGLVPVDAQGLATSSADFETAAGEDADSDGFTNAQEYQWGTHPKDKDSFPRLAISGGAVTWESFADREYTIQTKTNLAGGWNTAGTYCYPTNTHSITNGAPAGFFRGRAEVAE